MSGHHHSLGTQARARLRQFREDFLAIHRWDGRDKDEADASHRVADQEARGLQAAGHQTFKR